MRKGKLRKGKVQFPCGSCRQGCESDCLLCEKVKSLFLTPPSVERVVMDFESATWSAVRKVFPGVTLQGCAFHWSQVVYRKVQVVVLGHCLSPTTIMLPKGHKRTIIEKLHEYVPSFTDVFDEESFYIFVFIFVVATILVTFLLSRRIDLSDSGHID